MPHMKHKDGGTIRVEKSQVDEFAARGFELIPSPAEAEVVPARPKRFAENFEVVLLERDGKRITAQRSQVDVMLAQGFKIVDPVVKAVEAAKSRVKNRPIEDPENKTVLYRDGNVVTAAGKQVDVFKKSGWGEVPSDLSGKQKDKDKPVAETSPELEDTHGPAEPPVHEYEVPAPAQVVAGKKK